ncbi:MAG: four helix bundle protein [Patescibacteria group bacterium]
METPLKDFTSLRVWQHSRHFAVKIYKITSAFPRDEIFGLTSQLRRASVSIASNIAEGFGRFSFKEKVQFYNIAQSSLIETQNQLIISKDVDYLPEKEFHMVYNESVLIAKMLSALVRSSRSKFGS